MQFLPGSLLELITQTSTNLPPDVRAAMAAAVARETPGTQSSQALNIMASDVDMAAEDEGPICQDTGMPTFLVRTPVGVNQLAIAAAIREAVVVVSELATDGIPGVVKAIEGTLVLVDFTSPRPEIHPGMQAEVRLLIK